MRKRIRQLARSLLMWKVDFWSTMHRTNTWMDNVSHRSIRYISQEFTYLGWLLIRGGSRCSYPKQDGESYDNTECFINAVCADWFRSFQIRHCEQGDHYKGTYPECTSQLHGPLKLRDKSIPMEKGKSILNNPPIKVYTVQCPADSYVSIAETLKMANEANATPSNTTTMVNALFDRRRMNKA